MAPFRLLTSLQDTNQGSSSTTQRLEEIATECTEIQEKLELIRLRRCTDGVWVSGRQKNCDRPDFRRCE